MTSVVRSAIDKIDAFWEMRDKRMDGWAFMGSPFPTVLMCMMYFYLIKVIGPRYMENRQAFQLRPVLALYNIYQITFNAWLFYQLGSSGWFQGNFNIFCQPMDYSDSESAIRVLHAGYWFFISKFIDFFDTIFFVLRKNNRQITVLHLAHHGFLPINLWPGIRYVSGGHASFFALLNTLVHVFMYTYYLLASMGPQYQKFIRWKRHLTTMQIVQFVLASTHCFQLLIIDCDFPTAFGCWIGANQFFFLCLFLHFYRTNYLKRNAPANAGSAQPNSSAAIQSHASSSTIPSPSNRKKVQ